MADDFEYVRKYHKPCLLYEKHVDSGKRDSRLTAFLDNIQQANNADGSMISRFQTIQQLTEQVQNDVRRLLSTRFRPTFNSAITGSKNKGMAIGTNFIINQY